MNYDTTRESVMNDTNIYWKFVGAQSSRQIRGLPTDSQSWILYFSPISYTPIIYIWTCLISDDISQSDFSILSDTKFKLELSLYKTLNRFRIFRRKQGRGGQLNSFCFISNGPTRLFILCVAYSKPQNLHWKLGRLTPSFGSTLALRLKK